LAYEIRLRQSQRSLKRFQIGLEYALGKIFFGIYKGMLIDSAALARNSRMLRIECREMWLIALLLATRSDFVRVATGGFRAYVPLTSERGTANRSYRLPDLPVARGSICGRFSEADVFASNLVSEYVGSI
jgi:hypothetical protein